MTTEKNLEAFRGKIEEINLEILELLSLRAKLAGEIKTLKTEGGMPFFCPEREKEMLDTLVSHNLGPLSDDVIKKLFKEIFRASLNFMEKEDRKKLFVSREYNPQDIRVKVLGAVSGAPALIAGPCAVECEEQMEQIAALLVETGVKILRAGAFKPRTSPYAFQGLGIEGLKLLNKVGKKYGLITISEVTDTRYVEIAAEYLDIIQIGARNMYNYDLLQEAGRAEKPILLKRGLSATIDEFMHAAEYIVKEGNDQIILCERGIRTFETQTRNTLDIAAVPLLKNMTRLPVVVDLSHAAGRKDILTPLGRAALAAGADALMVEAHPNPELARSDAKQQLSPPEFREFLENLFPQKTKRRLDAPPLIYGRETDANIYKPV